MHTPIKRCEYTLHAAAIDEISDAVQAYLSELKYEAANIARIRLTIEEVLLIWRDRLGEDKTCTLIMGKRLRKPFLALEMAGPALNPFVENEEFLGPWGHSLLARLGLKPEYTYAHETNGLRFELKAPAMNPVLQILLAIGLAIVCGLAGFMLPDGLRTGISGEILPRISDAFFRMLSMISGPLVFLSVLVGICSIGDTATLSGVGKRIVTLFTGVSVFASAMGCLLYVVVFNMRPGAGGASSGAGLMAIVDMLFDMIPDNLFNPFLVNSSLQIIVLAALLGIAMLVLGKRTAALYSFVEQLQMVAQMIMGWLGALLPVVIFAVVLQNIWSDSSSALLKMWQPLAFTLAVVLMMLAAMVMFTSAKLHQKPAALLRSISSSFMIALTTASSSAAFGALVSGCKKMGVKKKLSDFGVPLGLVLCAPASVIGFLSCVLYSAQAYGIEVSLVGLLIAVISSAFLIIASPPVAGGMMSCYAVVFMQLGIPAEGLGVVMTLNVFLDFFCTAVNVAMIQLLLAAQGKKLDNWQ